jgi:hypothetical protein
MPDNANCPKSETPAPGPQDTAEAPFSPLRDLLAALQANDGALLRHIPSLSPLTRAARDALALAAADRAGLVTILARCWPLGHLTGASVMFTMDPSERDLVRWVLAGKVCLPTAEEVDRERLRREAGEKARSKAVQCFTEPHAPGVPEMPIFRVTLERCMDFSVAGESEEAVAEAFDDLGSHEIDEWDLEDWDISVHPVHWPGGTARGFDMGVLDGKVMEKSDYEKTLADRFATGEAVPVPIPEDTLTPWFPGMEPATAKEMPK